MDSAIELLVMQLRSEIEQLFSKKEFREPIVQDLVKASLEKELNEKKISSTEYQSALDILKRYESNITKDLK